MRKEVFGWKVSRSSEAEVVERVLTEKRPAGSGPGLVVTCNIQHVAAAD